jgi:hypothetical protein
MVLHRHKRNLVDISSSGYYSDDSEEEGSGLESNVATMAAVFGDVWRSSNLILERPLFE